MDTIKKYWWIVAIALLYWYFGRGKRAGTVVAKKAQPQAGGGFSQATAGVTNSDPFSTNAGTNDPRTRLDP